MKKLFAVIVMSLGALMLSGCLETGTGEKIGVVTKLAKTGVICPTWEAEIIRGGMSAGSGAMGAAFHFTIENPADAEKLKDAMEKQQEVKITYRQEAVTFCRSDSRNYFLTSISVAHPEAQTRPINVSPTAPGAKTETVEDMQREVGRLIMEMAKKQQQSQTQ